MYWVPTIDAITSFHFMVQKDVGVSIQRIRQRNISEVPLKNDLLGKISKYKDLLVIADTLNMRTLMSE